MSLHNTIIVDTYSYNQQQVISTPTHHQISPSAFGSSQFQLTTTSMIVGQGEGTKDTNYNDGEET